MAIWMLNSIVCRRSIWHSIKEAIALFYFTTEIDETMFQFGWEGTYKIGGP